ncbi:methyltransferase domain-containing protein [Candidatus Njordibacter sp. Uisw_039]|uniref:methyltransferase domain-containing protein n=1 Tax=Candidatus Njordibacter sp. Uisw_039 TaxID=3230972 RepID=UPI003D4E01D4
MSDYLTTYYSEERRPTSDYPLKLAKYISEKYLDASHKKLLDIGCGRGDQLRAFSAAGYDVVGCDNAESAKDLCEPHSVEILNILTSKLELKDGSVDVVFSKSVIEHLTEPEKLLKEAQRVLRPGGKIVLMCPSWVHNAWGPFYIDHTHVTPFTKPSLRDILKLEGFKAVQVKHFRQLPITWKYPVTEYLFRLISRLPIPFSPIHDVNYHQGLNKIVRFSNEVMLLAVAEKDAT